MSCDLVPIPGAPKLSIHADRPAVGRAAAAHVVTLLSECLRRQGSARVVFACAPSQDQFLEALVELSKGRVDWSRVTGFHMDEYVGLDEEHPASFRKYIHRHFLSQVHLKAFHSIAAEAIDTNAECARYAELVEAEPIDLICLGIGENGHLAFNDPPVADFNDTVSVKLVELDLPCREQQVYDGCFSQLAEVPRYAITLTLPVFRRATHLSVVVPGERKATAVWGACRGEVCIDCPASLLRTRDGVFLFVDRAAAVLLGD